MNFLASMNVAVLVVLLVLALVVFLLLVLGGLVFWLRKKLERKEKAARAALAGENVLMSTTKSNFFGLDSLGVKQIRGNGVLVLTEKQLAFFMVKPVKVISVPLDRVLKTETPMSFCSKAVGQPLLAVYFRNNEGVEDGAGFWVPSPPEWVAAVSEAAGLEPTEED